MPICVPKIKSGVPMTFDAKQENSTPDDDEKFLTEVSKLSEQARFELRRRLDEADYLGRFIVDEKRALEVARENWVCKITEARNLKIGGLSGIVIIALIAWFFPEWIKDQSFLYFLLFGWGLVNFTYNELICPRNASEMEKRQAAYEDACYRWSVATGMRWGAEALAAYHDWHHFSGHATPDERDELSARVERSVMRVVKNRGALYRYDMW